MRRNAAFTKKERLAALTISLFVLLLGLFNLDNNCNWGDDYAAYMSDGIAIAQGRYNEQILLNSVLRDGRLNDPVEHIHSFGMPLIHAVVYKAAGFDTVGFNNVYMYKLPTLLAFSASAGIFFLFLISRFNALLSLFGCILLFSCGVWFNDIRNLGNDVLFMSMSLISFFCAERFFYDGVQGTKKAILTGILLWFTYSVRLNGISVVLAVLLLQSIEIIASKKKVTFSDTLPYLVFALLFAVINVGVFPKPTSTSSVTKDFEFSKLASGIVYFSGKIYTWVDSLTVSLIISPLHFVLSAVFPHKDPITFYKILKTVSNISFLLLFFIGLFKDGGERNMYITVFSLFTFLITASLNLGQELRYLLVVLPFIVMFFCSGVKTVFSRLFRNNERLFCILRTASVSLACVLLSLPIIKADIENVKINNRELLTAYSDYAVDIYDYIQENLTEEDTISFFKPRALYLNTGRISIPLNRNGSAVDMTDYYLYYKPSHDFLLDDEQMKSYIREYENEEFELYRKITSDGD